MNAEKRKLTDVEMATRVSIVGAFGGKTAETASEESGSAIEHYRQGEKHICPLLAGEVEMRHAERSHRQRQNPGRDHTEAHASVFGGLTPFSLGVGARLVALGYKHIAGLVEGVSHGVGRSDRRIPCHCGRTGSEVDVGFCHSGERGEGLLNSSGAHGAHHAGERKCLFDRILFSHVW